MKIKRDGVFTMDRRRNLGRLYYCEKSPRQLWVTMSRARNKKGKLETWYLVSNLKLRAEPMAKEYGFRFCCEEGFRDAKWYLGFAEARVAEIDAWSRLFALFAIALLVLTTLGMALLIRGGPGARQLLRRVASRRRGRCELSLVSAMIALVQKERSLFAALSPQTKLNLEVTLSNVLTSDYATNFLHRVYRRKTDRILPVSINKFFPLV